MSYKQNLYKIVEPIKRTTITRMNRGKKWKYGYNKEHDIIVISKNGTIGEIYEIQNLRIALPNLPRQVYKHELNKWVKFDQPKEWKLFTKKNNIITNKELVSNFKFSSEVFTSFLKKLYK